MSAEGWGESAALVRRRLYICADVWVRQGFSLIVFQSAGQENVLSPHCPLGLLRGCFRPQMFPLFPRWQDRSEMACQSTYLGIWYWQEHQKSPFDI